MFDRKFFAGMRREGLGVGISKGRLSEALLEILVQLPEGITRLKETCVHHLGLIGPMSAVRDIDAAWTQTKKRAAREYPDKFTLDDHGVLHWAGRAPRPLDKKISRETFEKLNELAEEEGCTVLHTLEIFAPLAHFAGASAEGARRRRRRGGGGRASGLRGGGSASPAIKTARARPDANPVAGRARAVNSLVTRLIKAYRKGGADSGTARKR